MMSHGNIISDYHGMKLSGVEMKPDDLHFSYLPLAHMFERTVMSALLSNGAAVAFFSGDTRHLLQDLQQAKPTIFISVPRLLNKIYNSVMASQSGPKALCACAFPPPRFAKWCFHKGLRAKTALLEKNVYED